MFQKQDTFALKNFEGPIDFLVYLIQREEINIYDVSLNELTKQFLVKIKEWQDKQIETGAEFIGTAAYLVWLKSKTLLPNYDEGEEALLLEEEDDPNFEIIHHLLDYCRFKQAAKELTTRQEQQSACFFRGSNDNPEWKKPLGIDHISLDELSVLFKDMMGKASLARPIIQEENWRVGDKIRSIRQLISEQNQFNINTLFLPNRSRVEWIVIFLALLELMKIGDIGIGRESSSQSIIVFSKNERPV
ncbi:MAG: segregation/condensation protein A [Parachlamydiaceae bacterium]|nr:segregation/condensation protein A [Parachlamydiaceae bacterium]